ncbi:MAG: tyrosine-type recombinase/integrase [Oligosphaeraceae bacterium]
MTESEAALVEKAARLRRCASEERADRIPLDEAFSLHRYIKRHGVKESSARVAGYYWERFVKWCKDASAESVSDLTPRICEGFVESCAPRAAQHAVIYCRQILRDCGCRKELFPPVPRHRDVVHREPLTMDEVRKLLEYIDGKAERGGDPAREFSWYVRFLMYTGLRMGDAATLTAGMCRDGVLRRIMGKTMRPVEFPLHPSLVSFVDGRLAEGAAPGDYLFPHVEEAYRHDRRNLSHKFSDAMDAIGLSGRPGQYCAHCLRATFATLCAEHGIPMAVIQSWLGHTSPMVTRIYARIEDMKRKREALARFPALG